MALRTPPQPPPIFTSTPSSILSTTTRLIKASKQAHLNLINSVSPSSATFTNVLLPLAHAENALNLESTLILFHSAVSPDKPTRDASSKARTLLRDYQVECSMDQAVFALVDAVFNSPNQEDLDPESRNFLIKRHRDFVKDGLRVPPGPKRDRFKQIRSRLEELATDFAKNIAEDETAVYFSHADLEGFPKDELSRLERGEKGTGSEGKLKVQISRDLSTLLRTVTSATTRRVARAAYDTRCAPNVPIFAETIRLRAEAAALLGYANHAELAIEDKMAGTPGRVDGFLASLRGKLAAGGRDEVEALLRLKKRHVESRGEEFDGRLFVWDVPFYSNLLLKGEYAVDHGRIAEYFPLPTTVKGMLGTFEQLFGIEFHEIVGEERDALSPTGKGEDVIWHPDVQLFAAWDSKTEGGAFLGYLYLDLYQRDGKYDNPSNFSLVPGLTKEDSTRNHPSTALLCAFPPPTPQKPTLLRHFDVVTLFHELGHGVHDLLSRTRLARFHGPMGVAVDFGEAPSQVLENWCWASARLRALSRHYSYLSEEYLAAWRVGDEGAAQPPEEIPGEMVDALLRARRVGSKLGTLQQLFIGVFDMRVHGMSREGAEASDFTELWSGLRREIVPTDDASVFGEGEGLAHVYVSIGHLMNEYDAGFYSYLFSKVYAQDIFATVFEADPMSVEAGRRYRYGVLEKGGSQPEMKTLTNFLGREARMQPFYEDLGLDV